MYFKTTCNKLEDIKDIIIKLKNALMVYCKISKYLNYYNIILYE